MAQKQRVSIETIKCKVKVLCPLPGVFAKYQPTVGEIYEADYRKAKFYGCGQKNSPVCVIKVRDKSICLKTGEYEILED
jgi:hypothetical protein